MKTATLNTAPGGWWDRRNRCGSHIAMPLQLMLGLLLAGCGNMKDQEYARTEEPRPDLPHGTSAQLPPAGTVPHGSVRPDAAVATGERGGQPVPDIPAPVTDALVARGRERFDIYCAVCHGSDGYGQGIVVRRGFPAPPSYHDPRLRNAPAGYFFRVITQGHGLMYSYADRLTVADRWAVVAYIRALQLSQHARVADLGETDRNRLPAP
jgi:mono/diheme cytochrome c family protein